jgi:phospholipase C
VEPGKHLQDSWSAAPSYNLSVYGPNGFFRHFSGSVGPKAANLDVFSRYGTDDCGSLKLKITNVGTARVEVTVLDAYSGEWRTRHLEPWDSFEDELSSREFHGWYELIITVEGDSTFKYRLAGHVETGEDSFSDPALGGLVSLKG